MKIAFIVSSFPVISETFIMNQITGLIDLGHDVDIFSRSTPTSKMAHKDIEKYQLQNRTYYLDITPENRIRRALGAIGLVKSNIRKNPRAVLSSLNFFKYKRAGLSLYLLYPIVAFLQKQYDILQCHFGPNGNYGVILKKMGLPGKLVTMFHGYDIRRGLNTNSRIYDPLFKYGDCFLAISDENYKSLIKFGADREKVVYHPVGIDTGQFFPIERTASASELEKIVILTVARLCWEKGLPYGILAIKRLLKARPNLNLEYRIVGEGPLEFNLRTLVDDLQLNNCVRFLGPLSQNKIIRQYHEAHIFLLPSNAEVLPVVLMEAQATGIPAIATRVGSVAQALQEGETGFLVPPQDPSAIADFLTHLIERPQLREEMGKKGREFVERNYDIDELNRRLVQIYESL